MWSLSHCRGRRCRLLLIMIFSLLITTVEQNYKQTTHKRMNTQCARKFNKKENNWFHSYAMCRNWSTKGMFVWLFFSSVCQIITNCKHGRHYTNLVTCIRPLQQGKHQPRGCKREMWSHHLRSLRRRLCFRWHGMLLIFCMHSYQIKHLSVFTCLQWLLLWKRETQQCETENGNLFMDRYSSYERQTTTS